MAERKNEIEISAPLFFQYSCNLGLITHLYQEALGDEAIALKYLGVLASMELLGEIIPEDVFEFFGYCLEYAASNHVIIDTDGSKTPIPPFDPEDSLCIDCHELVDIAMVQYGFVASIKGGTNPLKDYLGGIFTYSGIAFEGIDSGYHLKDDQIKGIYEQLKNNFMPNEDAAHRYREQLIQKINYLKNIFEKE